MPGFEEKVDDATREGKVLGVVAMGVARDGTPILNHTSGRVSLSPSAQPITTDSIFTLASATKLITSIAALQLVETSVLPLDSAPFIEQHLPELYTQDVFSNPAPDDFNTTPRRNPITLRNLLTHTSGSSADFLDPKLMAWRAQHGQEPELYFSAPLPEALCAPLKFQPGEGWTYGSGLDWTGLLIARVTGRSLDEYLRTEIFDRVGCDSRIGFRRSKLDAEYGIVEIVTRGPDGKLVSYPWPKPACEVADRGGGGLYGSVANYMRILSDLIAPSPRLLSPETINLLFASQLDQGSAALKDLHAASPIFGMMMSAMMSAVPVESVNYALGGALVTKDSGLGRTEGTLMWGGAFNCPWFACRKSGVAGFYASAMFPPCEEVSVGLMDAFVKEVWERSGSVVVGDHGREVKDK